MPLSNKDLADIAKEFTVTKTDSSDAKTAISGIDDQAVKTQAQADRLFMIYRNINDERVVPYQMEHRWLDGTTYTNIPEQDIIDSGAREDGNVYFPPAWKKKKENAKLSINANGNPKTISTGDETEFATFTVVEGGFLPQVNLLLNGQVGDPSDTLSTSYSPGASVIHVNNFGHGNGKMLYLSGSGTSALVLITGVSGTTLAITELVPPQNTMAIGSSVIENIPGFSNAERTTLTSTLYQNILIGLTGRIATAAAAWNAILTNQATQLNMNVDNAPSLATAKTNMQNAQGAYSTWLALPDTGITGKYTDTSLSNLTTAYNTKNANIVARVAEIVAVLGSIAQNALGDYSGTGLYLQRFKALNFLINAANGPLFKLTGVEAAKVIFQQKIANSADKLTTYANLVKYSLFSEDATGTTSIKVEQPTYFSIGNVVQVNGNELPTIVATITNIVGPTITLDKTIPEDYNKGAKASIIKSI